MNVLVLAAHPDDEVLGCGGTVAKLSSEGHEVHFAILGEGITSRYRERSAADGQLLEALHAHSRKAGEILGVRSVQLKDLPDNRFDTVPLLEIVKIIENLVEQIQPEVVFTQHGGDLNIDHERIFRATLTATRPMQGCPVRAVYAYEVPSSTDWAFGQFSPALSGHLFFDISETLEKKIAAMQCYESEARDFPHPRSPEALRAVARRWGSVTGSNAAEAFSVIRELR